MPFEINVLEVLKKKETGSFNEKEELRKLDEKWFDQVQPYGENGLSYKKIRRNSILLLLYCEVKSLKRKKPINKSKRAWIIQARLHFNRTNN
ncbi:hypothetical protein [Bacillus sp. AFS031507]|uniref:hypothetical protein n=1 Tax=Bacillus sp. AFS031507 TaxID=2033496 RepID=UPI0035A0A4CA